MYQIFSRNFSKVPSYIIRQEAMKNQILGLNNRNKKKVFSYGKWFNEYKKPLNRIKRQVKIKEFLDQTR